MAEKSAKVVLIGCRLPQGLILHHPLKPDVKVTLAGLYTSKIIGATYVTTEVDAEFWETWKIVHEGKFQPLDSGAIFEASSEDAAKRIAKELTKEKTGFEPLKQDAAGVKPANK
jgi:hypothetical protein